MRMVFNLNIFSQEATLQALGPIRHCRSIFTENQQHFISEFSQNGLHCETHASLFKRTRNVQIFGRIRNLRFFFSGKLSRVTFLTSWRDEKNVWSAIFLLSNLSKLQRRALKQFGPDIFNVQFKTRSDQTFNWAWMVDWRSQPKQLE